jgi:hypothetical protein
MRKIEDAKVSAELALPAAAATATTAAVKVTKGAENFQVVFGHEVVPSLADTKTLTLTLQDSANGTDGWAAIPALATVVSTGAGGAGAAAKSSKVTLPATTKAYVRVSAAVEAAGGNNTAKKFYVKGKF